MSRNTKIALAILGGLILVCVCVSVGGFIALRVFGQKVAQSVTTDPTQAVQVAQGIADFQTPEGYKLEAMSIFGLNMVILDPNDSGSPVIMLMQLPANAGASSQQMQEQMQRAMQQQTNWTGLNMHPAGTRDVEIRGQQVTLNIQEGADSNGTEIRQETGAFQGKGGTALVMIMGPTASWDDTVLDDFLASLQ